MWERHQYHCRNKTDLYKGGKLVLSAWLSWTYRFYSTSNFKKQQHLYVLSNTVLFLFPSSILMKCVKPSLWLKIIDNIIIYCIIRFTSLCKNFTLTWVFSRSFLMPCASFSVLDNPGGTHLYPFFSWLQLL